MFKTAFATALIAAAAQADTPHDDAKISGLVEGFFIGAFDFRGMTDIGHCISAANPVEQHVENAMRGFWNGTYQEATKAVDQLGLAVSDIGDMLDHCGKIDHHDYEQIQRMAESFLHPKQILLEATESLIVNGVNIFEDTREGLHDYRMGKWLDAGEHFGQAAAMVLYGKTQMVDHEELFYDFDNHWQELLDQIDHEKDEKMHHFEAMKSSNVHFTFFRMGKILEGLLAGSVEAEVPHGVECLRDAKHIWERFGGVIDQLKHAQFNSVLHGIEDMGHIIGDIANELEECKATVGTDLDKLRELSKAFTDPWYFIFHVEHDLIVNGQDVHHEITDAQAQWENQHFYEFGHSVGLALSKIALGGKMKNDIPLHYLPQHVVPEEHVHYLPLLPESRHPLYHYNDAAPAAPAKPAAAKPEAPAKKEEKKPEVVPVHHADRDYHYIPGTHEYRHEYFVNPDYSHVSPHHTYQDVHYEELPVHTTHFGDVAHYEPEHTYYSEHHEPVHHEQVHHVPADHREPRHPVYHHEPVHHDRYEEHYSPEFAGHHY